MAQNPKVYIYIYIYVMSPKQEFATSVFRTPETWPMQGHAQ